MTLDFSRHFGSNLPDRQTRNRENKDIIPLRRGNRFHANYKEHQVSLKVDIYQGYQNQVIFSIWNHFYRYL